MPDDLPRVEQLDCMECHATFERVRTRGIKPLRCPPCKTKPRKRKPVKVLPPKTAQQKLALAVTDYRLAIEMATAALRLGHYQDALDALEAVQPKQFMGRERKTA